MSMNTLGTTPIKAAFALGTISSNLEPGSPEFQQVQNRLNDLNLLNQDQFTSNNPLLGQQPNLTNIAGALSAISSNLEPGSPEFQQVQNRLNDLNLLNQDQFTSNNPLLSQQPNLANTAGALATIQSNLEPGSPEFQQIQNRQNSLSAVQTNVPQADTNILANRSNATAGNSNSDINAMLNQLNQLLNNMMTSLTSNNSAASTASPNLANTAGALATIQSNLEPGSPEFQQIQNRQNLLNALQTNVPQAGTSQPSAVDMAFALGTISSNLEPGSPEFQQIQDRLKLLKTA